MTKITEVDMKPEDITNEQLAENLDEDAQVHGELSTETHVRNLQLKYREWSAMRAEAARRLRQFDKIAKNMPTRDMTFDEANELNIPVSIWLFVDDEDEGCWILCADCYQPRRGCVHPEAFFAKSSDRCELANIVRDKILPLYRVAVLNLEAVVLGHADYLYFWEPQAGKLSRSDRRLT